MAENYATMNAADLRKQAEIVLDKMLIDAGVNGGIASIRSNPLAKAVGATGKLETTLDAYAQTLDNVIDNTVKQNPTSAGQELTAKVLENLAPALKANQQFSGNLRDLNGLARMQNSNHQDITVEGVVKETGFKLVTLAPATVAQAQAPASPAKPSAAPATPDAPAAKPATPAQPETPKEKPLYQGPLAKDKELIAQGIGTMGLPFSYDAEELGKMLQTTVEKGKPHLPEAIRNKKSNDPILALWDSMGLGEAFEALQKFLMEMFMGPDGDVYGGARKWGQCMFDTAKSIDMCGPGEGVFKNYEGKIVNDKGEEKTITVYDLQEVSVFNAKITDMKKAGASKEDIEKVENEREQYVQQKFGADVTSDEIWQVFQKDKQTLITASLDKIGEQARADGLIDTPRGPELYQGYLGAKDGKRGNAAVPELLQPNKNNIVQAKDEQGNPLFEVDPKTGELKKDADGNLIPVMKVLTGIQPQSRQDAREFVDNSTDLSVASPNGAPAPSAPASSADITITPTASSTLSVPPAPIAPAAAPNPYAAALQNCSPLNLGVGANDVTIPQTGCLSPAAIRATASGTALHVR